MYLQKCWVNMPIYQLVVKSVIVMWEPWMLSDICQICVQSTLLHG